MNPGNLVLQESMTDTCSSCSTAANLLGAARKKGEEGLKRKRGTSPSNLRALTCLSGLLSSDNTQTKGGGGM